MLYYICPYSCYLLSSHVLRSGILYMGFCLVAVSLPHYIHKSRLFCNFVVLVVLVVWCSSVLVFWFLALHRLKSCPTCPPDLGYTLTRKDRMRAPELNRNIFSGPKPQAWRSLIGRYSMKDSLSSIQDPGIYADGCVTTQLRP
jgi:hypothetical protein